jgi:hypothetical protein
VSCTTSLRAARLALATIAGLCAPLFSGAHHSTSEYDQKQITEIAGTLSEVLWQNPHAMLKVTVVEAGKTVVWEIECSPISTLERSSVNRAALRIGDTVKVAGFPSRLSPTRLFGTNLLTPASGEIVLALALPPRWQAGATTSFAMSAGGNAAATPPTPGLLKVWSTAMADPDANPYSLWRAKVSLTPAARSALAGWDSLRDTVANGCDPLGMPTIMAQPWAMQFEDHGDTILLRLEQYDTVRTIHMIEASPAPTGKSLLGHSLGKWDGNALVVFTTGISWRFITPNGLPLGPSARLQERFVPSADGRRLNYTLLIDDPHTFTVSPVLARSWVWRENEHLREYACGKGRELAPDPAR